MFVDEVTLTVQGGNGGNGAVAFYPMKKGPCGGHGGNGGKVYVQGNSQMADLHKYTGVRIIKAKDGGRGENFNKQGKDGGDHVVYVPIGTLIENIETGKSVEIIDTTGIHILADGGKGGRGNSAFKSSTNQVPRKAEQGEKTNQKHYHLILKLIADFGFIGLPNAGKSTLLNELTNAKVKTAMYAFTTLEPNLGVCANKILADIPGLIEGASKGKGLGIKFLKHIEKVPILLHCISADTKDVCADFEIVMKELMNYNPEIVQKKQIILITKTDLSNDNKIQKQIENLQKFNKPIMLVSIYNPSQMRELFDLLQKKQ